MKLLPQIIEISDYVRIYDNSSSTPIPVFEKNETGKMLLNREKRDFCTDYYIAQPLDEQNIRIHQDLSCEETEKLKNSW
jgi:Uncharacterized protein conserved in bacteria